MEKRWGLERKGRITALTAGPDHHFFGYYGISPWNSDLGYHLCLTTDFHETRPGPADVAQVGLVNTDTDDLIPFASTRAFNFQQGSMMHWITVAGHEEFTFNDHESDALVSRAVDCGTRSSRVLDKAIAAVSPSAPAAVGLDFNRMAHCRAVVGYANDRETPIEPVPEDDGLWGIDLATGKAQLLIAIAEVIRTSGFVAVQAGPAWFNHVLYSPDGRRVFFLCRAVREGEGWYSSLWTINADGSGLVCEIGFGHKISHFDWRDSDTILISSDVLDNEMGFCLLQPGGEVRPFLRDLLPRDGHASFSPDRNWLLTDTYARGPEHARELMLVNIEEKRKISLGTFTAPEHIKGDVRCDLHPRWRPDGMAVSFDAVHEGSRQIYIADVGDLVGGRSV